MSSNKANTFTDEKEHQEYIAGLELAKSFVNVCKEKQGTKPLTNERKHEIEKTMLSMMIPSPYKNISVDKLKQMLVNDYLQEASGMLMNSFKSRQVLFAVKKTDEDIIPDLQKNWTEKGIKNELLEKDVIHEGVACRVVKLNW